MTSQKLVDRVRKYKLGEEPVDTEFWSSRPALERLALVQQIRCEFPGGQRMLSRDWKELFELFGTHDIRRIT